MTLSSFCADGYCRYCQQNPEQLADPPCTCSCHRTEQTLRKLAVAATAWDELMRLRATKENAMAYPYDERCYELAEYFSSGTQFTPREIAELAQAIQRTVEDFFQAKKEANHD
ncbi:MAG TPA: hypothetical protein VJ816_08310 [Gemmatimonadales bacterium]|nr:hypothetical protein [Gemmatimonadales bacterium]